MPLHVHQQTDGTEPDLAGEGAAALPALNESALDRFRAAHRRLDDGVEEFELPPYGGIVVVKYRRLRATRSPDEADDGRKTLAEIARLARDEDPYARAYNELLLVEACDEILVRMDDGALEPMGSPAVRFDDRFAEAMSLTADAPAGLLERLVLREAFNHNDAGLNQHAADVYAWTVYGSLKPEDTGQGEALASPTDS